MLEIVLQQTTFFTTSKDFDNSCAPDRDIQLSQELSLNHLTRVATGITGNNSNYLQHDLTTAPFLEAESRWR